MWVYYLTCCFFGALFVRRLEGSSWTGWASLILASIKCADFAWLAFSVLRARGKIMLATTRIMSSSDLMINAVNLKRKAIPWWKRFELAHAQGFRCAACWHVLPKTIHVDHIKPLHKGGSNDDPNLQVLCPSCHDAKTITQDPKT